MIDLIVIGAGPAGVMASIMAATKGKKVLIIERNDTILKKLSISGGGRCNLTNLKSINDFINEIPVNKKFLYSSLNNFGPQNIYDYFTNLGVKLLLENHDKVFPLSNKSLSIVNALNEELINKKVMINYNERVISININDSIYQVITDKNIYNTKNVVVATGGFSYTYTGSTGDGYRIAKDIKQSVTDIYPAETFIKTKPIFPLSGVTLDDVNIKYNNKINNGSLLFTHIGLSGPTIFKISGELYKEIEQQKIPKICIDFIPKFNDDELINKIRSYEQSKNIFSFVQELLPKRLVDYLLKDIVNQRISEISKIKINEIIRCLKNYEVEVTGTGSIEQSIVTGGGVDIKNINSKTMESTIYKGLYFVGELLDIHGHTGGYNITISLSTGYTAGISIGDKND